MAPRVCLISELIDYLTCFKIFIYIIITFKEEFVLILNMDADKEKTKGEETYEEIQRIR